MVTSSKSFYRKFLKDPSECHETARLSWRALSHNELKRNLSRDPQAIRRKEDSSYQIFSKIQVQKYRPTIEIMRQHSLITSQPILLAWRKWPCQWRWQFNCLIPALRACRICCGRSNMWPCMDDTFNRQFTRYTLQYNRSRRTASRGWESVALLGWVCAFSQISLTEDRQTENYLRLPIPLKWNSTASASHPF